MDCESWRGWLGGQMADDLASWAKDTAHSSIRIFVRQESVGILQTRKTTLTEKHRKTFHMSHMRSVTICDLSLGLKNATGRTEQQGTRHSNQDTFETRLMFKVSKRQSEKGQWGGQSGLAPGPCIENRTANNSAQPVKKHWYLSQWVSLSEGVVRNSAKLGSFTSSLLWPSMLYAYSTHCKQSVRCSEMVKPVPVPNPKGLIAARYNRSLNRFEIFWVLRCSSKAPCLPDERNKTENHIVKRKLLLQNCQAGFDCTMLRNTTRGTEPVSMSSTKRKYLHANQTVPAFTSSPESTPKTNFLRGSNKPRGRLCGFMKKEIETYWST